MLANDPSSYRLEQGYEQNEQQNLERTAHLLSSIPLPFVNMDPKQAIDNIHMHSVNSGTM